MGNFKMNGERESNRLRRLTDLLESPRESLEIEIKSWLNLTSNEDRANLAQAILALANYGGGYIIIGFQEEANEWIPVSERPATLEQYSQDNVNDIVDRFAEPTFHCSVNHELREADGLLYPIITVPGNHRVPIRAARGGPNGRHIQHHAYYTRGPGPCSRPIDSPTEWDTLINRCVRNRQDDLVDTIRAFLSGAQIFQPNVPIPPSREERFGEWVSESEERWRAVISERQGEPQFSLGTWKFLYMVIGDFSPPTLTQLQEIIRNVQGHETGWPPWWTPTRNDIAPYPYEGNVECCVFSNSDTGRFRDAAHADFWRISNQGMAFLMRGYEEDSHDAQRIGIEPGTILALTLPVWRIGECLLHAERFGTRLAGASAVIQAQVQWRGLRNRRISNWASPHRMLFESLIARQDIVNSSIQVPCSSISSNLPEIVRSITAPLYEVFDFFSPPESMFHEEISNMRSRRSR